MQKNADFVKVHRVGHVQPTPRAGQGRPRHTWHKWTFGACGEVVSFEDVRSLVGTFS